VDEGGAELGGVDEGGVDDGGVDDGGVDDGGVDDGGVEEGGVDDGGADDGGAEDDGADLVGWADPEPDPDPEPEPAGWLGVGLIGVGARVVLNRDPAGVRNELGDSEAEGEGDVLGPDDGPAARAGAVAGFPAAACGSAWPAAGVRPAPIRAKAATADAIASPPVRQAEASGREMR
jgi:hypothetical protein